jgi:hypothetical protein
MEKKARREMREGERRGNASMRRWKKDEPPVAPLLLPTREGRGYPYSTPHTPHSMRKRRTRPSRGDERGGSTRTRNGVGEEGKAACPTHQAEKTRSEDKGKKERKKERNAPPTDEAAAYVSTRHRGRRSDFPLHRRWDGRVGRGEEEEERRGEARSRSSSR